MLVIAIKETHIFHYLDIGWSRAQVAAECFPGESIVQLLARGYIFVLWLLTIFSLSVAFELLNLWDIVILEITNATSATLIGLERNGLDT